MVAITDNTPGKKLLGVLVAKCSRCGKKGQYEMSEAEVKTYMEYQTTGRSKGSLVELFPNIPAWILSGAVEPLSDGKCICPTCQMKR